VKKLPARPGNRVGVIPVAPEVAPEEDLEVLPVVARLHEGRGTMVDTRSPLVPGEAVHLLHPTMEPQCMGHSVDTGGLLHLVDGVIGPGDRPVVPSNRQMSNRTDKKSMTVPTLGTRT